MAIEWRGRDVTPWVVNGGLALVLIAIVAFFGILEIYWKLTETNVDDVRSLIDHNVSTGATTEDIYKFLDSHGIEHGMIEQGNSDSDVTDAGYPDTTEVIGAIVRGTSHEFFSTGDILIFFILDSNHRLRDYIVTEHFTSL